jgi:hypothetical protein
MAANLRVEALERRNKAMAPRLDIDPAQRVVLPADYYVDSNKPIPQRVYPTVPLHPTRIDFLLPAAEMQTVDFVIPDEPDVWAAWAVARVKREATDAELTGFSECITMEGSSANVRRVSHKTRRVMEQRDLLFRFAIDHDIDSMAPEPPPIRVEETYNPIPDRIREANAHARKAGVNAPPRTYTKQAERGSRFPWVYVSGLASAVVLLGCAKFLHLV